ncbi:MAG: hypothetical protein FJZ90_02315 [Chloroflexi bacterium]|nr:hypothetical protein [Chloroflexota bacterium]
MESLLTTGDVTEAAAAAGVVRQTVHRWLDQDAFKAALREGEAAKLEALSRSLVRLGDKATQALEGTLDDVAAPAGVKVRTADIVLARLLQLKELVNLEQRVAALEETLESGH